MTFNNHEKGNRKYYEEIMYISSNYYIFKKRPQTKTHSLLKVFGLYSLLFLILLIIFLFIPSMIILSGILIDCFAYNTNAENFYHKNSYFNRTIEMSKKL